MSRTASKGAFVLPFEKSGYETKIFYITEKLKIDFFEKLFFSTSIKKLKTDFFEILIIFKNLSKYIKSDFFFSK